MKFYLNENERRAQLKERVVKSTVIFILNFIFTIYFIAAYLEHESSQSSVELTDLDYNKIVDQNINLQNNRKLNYLKNEETPDRCSSCQNLKKSKKKSKNKK